MALINVGQRHFMNNDKWSKTFGKADVIFVVDTGEIPGHRSILAQACPYFEKLLCGDFQESKSKRVQITGISAKVFKEVMRFIYYGQLKIIDWNIEDLLALFASAHEYQLERLMDGVTKALEKQQLDFNSWELVKSAASLYDSDALKAMCVSFVETKIDGFLSCKNLEKFTPDFIHSMLESPKVVSCSQDHLLAVICKWKNHHKLASISSMLFKINWTNVSPDISNLVLKDVFSNVNNEKDFRFWTKLAEMKTLQSEVIASVVSVLLLKNVIFEFPLEKYRCNLEIHFGVDCGISIKFRKVRVFRREIPVERIEFQSSTHFTIEGIHGCNSNSQWSNMDLSVSTPSNQWFKYSATFSDATPVCEIHIHFQNYGQLSNVQLQNLVIF